MALPEMRAALVGEMEATGLFRDVEPFLRLSYRRAPVAAVAFQAPSQRFIATQGETLNTYTFEIHIHPHGRDPEDRQEQLDSLVEAVLARLRQNPRLGGACDFMEVTEGQGLVIEETEAGLQVYFILGVVLTRTEEG